MAYTDELDRWLAAGLIDAGQASRIRAYEAGGGIPGPARRAGSQITATEVVAYLGAVVVLVGISFLVGTRYQELGSVGRDLILGLVTGAGIGFGLVMERRTASPAARRARAAGFLVGTFGFFALAGQVLVDARVLTRAGLHGGDDTSGEIMVAAFASALLAAALLWRSRAGLLALATAALGYAGVAAHEAWAGQSPMGWQSAGEYLAAGAVLFVYAEILARRAAGRLAAELLRFAAVIVPFLAAILLSFNEAWLEVFAIAFAISALLLAIRVGSVGLMIAGGTGLLIGVLEVGFRHFAQTLGYPVVLISSGLGLLALSLAMVRLLPRLRQRRSPAEAPEA